MKVDSQLWIIIIALITSQQGFTQVPTTNKNLRQGARYGIIVLLPLFHFESIQEQKDNDDW